MVHGADPMAKAGLSVIAMRIISFLYSTFLRSHPVSKSIAHDDVQLAHLVCGALCGEDNSISVSILFIDFALHPIVCRLPCT